MLKSTEIESAERSGIYDGFSECDTCGARVWDDDDPHTVADCIRYLRSELADLKRSVRNAARGLSD